jgi:hypothetical protein
MSVRSLLLLFSLLVTPALVAADVTLVRVFTGWRDAASFKRISEYFDGRENTGYYFLVRVANTGAPRSVTARLTIISSANGKPRDFSFTPALGGGDTVFHLGLTGADWPDAKASPVAWKLELTDAGGQVLASEKSYLWEKPAAE